MRTGAASSRRRVPPPLTPRPPAGSCSTRCAPLKRRRPKRPRRRPSGSDATLALRPRRPPQRRSTCRETASSTSCGEALAAPRLARRAAPPPFCATTSCSGRASRSTGAGGGVAVAGQQACRRCGAPPHGSQLTAHSSQPLTARPQLTALAQLTARQRRRSDGVLQCLPLCVPSRPCPSEAPTHSAERRAVALSHRPLEEGEEEGEED